MEVDYHGLRRDLRGELLKTGVDIGKPPMGNKGRYNLSKGCRRLPRWSDNDPLQPEVIFVCGIRGSGYRRSANTL